MAQLSPYDKSAFETMGNWDTMFWVIARIFLQLGGSWTGDKETGWSQITYVANRDSLRFRSSGLSGGLGRILVERI